MANAIWKEYELFCPVCNAYFKQLVVLHKVPKSSYSFQIALACGSSGGRWGESFEASGEGIGFFGYLSTRWGCISHWTVFLLSYRVSTS